MNIRRIYGFQFFWIFAIVTSILYPYYVSLGLNSHQFFLLQAIFGLTVATFEIPTGYLSDRFGRKKILCTGAIISGFSYWVLTQATGFWGLAAHEFFLGLALSFISGTDVAILFESLPPNSPRDLTSRVLGNNQMAASLGEFTAAILCTILMMSLSYKDIIAIQAIVAWMPFLISLTIAEPKAHQNTTLSFGKIKKLWLQLLHQHTLIRLMSYNFVVGLLATYLAVWIIQRYWQEQNIPVMWFGILWASSSFVIGSTGLLSRAIEKRLGLWKTLVLISLLYITAYLLMPIYGGIVGVLLGFLIYIARGLNNVISRDLLNQTMEPAFRATANSILNFLFRICFAILGPTIGFCIDRWGLNNALLGMCGFFVLCFLFITIPLLRRLTSMTAWEKVIIND